MKKNKIPVLVSIILVSIAFGTIAVSLQARDPDSDSWKREVLNRCLADVDSVFQDCLGAADPEPLAFAMCQAIKNKQIAKCYEEFRRL